LGDGRAALPVSASQSHALPGRIPGGIPIAFRAI